MLLNFEKYHGAGNDFIIIDGFSNNINLSQKQIELLCCRRFGIGADGLMIIEKSTDYDFIMRFYNSDGLEASMCGNGGRCVALFAFNHNFAGKKMNFIAPDGLHHAEIKENSILLSMNDVDKITEYSDGYFLNTGSPHFVKFTDNIAAIDVNFTGKQLADDKRFSPNRTNVNFIETISGNFKIATFERGVENETYACGTGAVASAIILFHTKKADTFPITLNAKGGVLQVSFEKQNDIYTNVKLEGPAVLVFEGQIVI